jgi:hypothetical protein
MIRAYGRVCEITLKKIDTPSGSAINRRSRIENGIGIEITLKEAEFLCGVSLRGINKIRIGYKWRRGTRGSLLF